ncbi:hypothetical protein Pyn_18635 [Prunus yedoensis var. nudiflora]|uniref:Uncharacterized protein n=1 Tax=Prunus yedoensis var. nudiflora TaxID=2094558 RepID=A0A314ZF28_PRUYE|nr:hypothetical protein Pyn_18635 [Prunus yedoensis var. nudiflora]
MMNSANTTSHDSFAAKDKREQWVKRITTRCIQQIHRQTGIGLHNKATSSSRIQPEQKAAPSPKTPYSVQGLAQARVGSHEPRQAHGQIQPELLRV